MPKLKIRRSSFSVLNFRSCPKQANAQNNIYFTKNGHNCHFEFKTFVTVSVAQLVTTVIFLSATCEVGQVPKFDTENDILEKTKLLLQKLFHYIVRYHWVEVNSITTARISIEKNSFSYRQDSLLKDTQRHIANFWSNISFALQFLLKNNNIEEELSWTAVLCSNLKFRFKICTKFVETLACEVLNR